MKDIIRLVTLGCLILILVGPHQTTAMYENVCRLFKNGTQLRDPYSCDGYIICVDSTEVKYKCPEGQLYSIDKSKCIASEEDGCENPCAPDYDGVWAADPKSCKGYYYCQKGVSLFGKCPDDLHFDEDSQMCVHSWQSECKSDEYCHITPNSVKFKNPDSCTQYYTCKAGALTPTSCKSGTAFNKETAACEDEKTIAGCENHCKGVKTKFTIDSKTCRGYYYCADTTDTNPIWYQCPEGTFFDKSTQACGDPLDIKCEYDRCDGRPDMFVNSNTDCMHYVTCKDGVSGRERLCNGYTFFDEKRQVCTSEVITYKACV